MDKGLPHNYLRAWHGAIVVVAVVVAIAGWSTTGSGAEGDDTKTEPFVAACRKIRPSVVAVGTYNPSDTPSVQYAGTGFVVDDGWTVATNQHVVEAVRKRRGLDDLQVFFPDAKPTEGRSAAVLLEDEHHDVALLRFEGAPAWPLQLEDQEPKQGADVGVMGYPIGLQLGLVPAAHRGVIAAVVPAVLPLPKGAKLTPELIEAIRRPYNLYQLDLVVYPGNSGSPLISARDGKVIGIINKTLATRTREHLLSKPSGIGYAVPVRWIQQLLKRKNAREESRTN